MSNNENLDKVIKERLNDIFPDQLTAARIVDLVVSKRPPNWSRNSNATYYTEFYGKQMQKAADLMIADKQDKVFRYSIFCGSNEEVISHQSLYIRVNQSRRFLVDCLDTPEKLYKTWFDSTKCSKVLGVGIAIKYVVGFRDGVDGFVPETILKDDDRPVWRKRMEDWIEGDEVKPFVQENLILSPAEITSLKKELSELIGIMASVSSSTIKIIRMR